MKLMFDTTKFSRMTGQKEQSATHPGQHSEPSVCNMGASCSFKNPENTQDMHKHFVKATWIVWFSVVCYKEGLNN